ncbi:MAG: thiamine diphosphokinase, partial [Chloroflexota bacterium]
MSHKNPRKAIIFVNGELSNPEKLRPYIQSADWIICANGGTRHAITLGVTPNIIVGDLDSLSPDLYRRLKTAGVQFETHPADKDQTDLELALQVAIHHGIEAIDLIAVMGGRVDQSLANLMLLARPEWASVQIRAITENEVIYPIRGESTVTLKGSIDDTLSLVPLAAQIS